MSVPPFLLKRMYQKGSLAASASGDAFSFHIKNHLATATFTAPVAVLVDDVEVGPEAVAFVRGEERVVPGTVTADAPFSFEKGDDVTVEIALALAPGAHKLGVVGKSKEWGEIRVEVEDTLSS